MGYGQKYSPIIWGPGGTAKNLASGGTTSADGTLSALMGTDWVSYTPGTANISTTSASGNWRRVGDSMEIDIYIVMSGAPSGTINVDIPATYAIDYNKLSRASFSHVGQAGGNDAGSGPTVVGNVLTESADANTLRIADITGVWDATKPFTWASTDKLTVRAVIPIVGWNAGS